jgi:hypothetical protein
MIGDSLCESRLFAAPLTRPISLVGAAGIPGPTNPAATLPFPLIAGVRPVWRGRPHVNGCAVPAAAVEATAPVTCGLDTAPFRPPSLTKRETEVWMCRVLNKHAAGRHDGAIYIGRGSKWGNPFRIGVDGVLRPSSLSMLAGFATSISCCARSMSFAARVCCAFAPPRHAMAICCCGSRTRRAKNASRGGVRRHDQRPHPQIQTDTGGSVEIWSAATTDPACGFRGRAGPG